MTKPTLSALSAGLGNIFQEQEQLNIKFIEYNWILSGETGHDALNVKGKTRVIMVQGSHDGTGYTGLTQQAKLADFIFEMDSWANGSTGTGNTQKSETYVNSFENSYSVKCFDWQWTRSVKDPNRIIYSILLKRV